MPGGEEGRKRRGVGYVGAVEKILGQLVERAARRGREAASRVKARVLGRVGAAPRYREGDVIPVQFAQRGGGEVLYGTTVLGAARQLRVDLDHFCGGHCSCGTCRVEVLAGAEHLSRRELNEEIVLGVEAARRGHRLACQARIFGPVEVQVPEFFLVR